ncbi:MAG: T9SS type A sorting domain-containing protein, partial [Flavobacteriales bacterium]
DITICNYVELEWQFTKVDVNDNVIAVEPIYVESNVTSKYLRISWIPDVQPGDRYRVRIRPVFDYGAGEWGTDYQLLCIAQLQSLFEENLEMADLQTADRVNLYPNPNNGSEFHIQLNSVESGEAQIRILDSFGKLVYSKKRVLDQESELIIKPEVELPTGLYFVEVVCNGELNQLKLIVQ